MKDQIRAILEQRFPSDGIPRAYGSQEAYSTKLDTAAEAVAALVENQPVDRVQAMAALVSPIHGPLYSVPDVGVSYLVDLDKPLCTCRERGCEHVEAVRLWERGKG